MLTISNIMHVAIHCNFGIQMLLQHTFFQNLTLHYVLTQRVQIVKVFSHKSLSFAYDIEMCTQIAIYIL